MKFVTRFEGEDALSIGLLSSTEIQIDDPVEKDGIWELRFRLIGSSRTLEEKVVAETPLMALQFAVRMMRKHLEPEYLSS